MLKTLKTQGVYKLHLSLFAVLRFPLLQIGKIT